MQIDPVNAQAFQTIHPSAQTRAKAMQPTANLLGESVDELKKDLAGGKTLDQLAQDKGVSHGDLVKSIADGMKAAAPAGAQAPAGFDPTQIADQIASGKAPQGVAPGGQAIGAASGNRLNDLAGALGVDPQQLIEQLQGDRTDIDSSAWSKTSGLRTDGLQVDLLA